MKPARAIRIAIESMILEQKKLHVDANLYAHYGATYPHARNSFERREKLRAAIATLEGMADNRAGLPLFENGVKP